MTVKMNGQVTAHMVNDEFKEGLFSLQFANGPKGAAGGPIKWRKVTVRPLELQPGKFVCFLSDGACAVRCRMPRA